VGSLAGYLSVSNPTGIELNYPFRAMTSNGGFATYSPGSGCFSGM
jgi:hypothetical protein